MSKDIYITKREKIVLIVLGALLTILVFIPQEVINKNETFLLLIILIPLGLIIATDPERNRENK